MKKVMLCVVLLLFCGCLEDFTPEQMQALAEQNDVLQKQVDEMQAVALEVAAEIQAAEIVDEAAVAKLAKINEDIDKAQAQMDIIAKALKGVPLTGDAAQDFIAQLQAANAASGGMNPYAIPIGAGLSILSIGLGWLAKWEAAKAAKSNKKYQAHKQGVEKTMKEVSTNPSSEVQIVESKLFKNIGDARASLGVKG